MITSLCFLSNEADPNHSEKSARSSGQMMTGDGFLSAENSLIFFPLLGLYPSLLGSQRVVHIFLYGFLVAFLSSEFSLALLCCSLTTILT